MTMVIFTIFFGILAKIPSEGIPYAIFAYSALVPWTYFANSITQASTSMVAYRSIVTKIYFPRLVIPFASVLSGLVDFALAFVVLIVMMMFYGITPSIAVILTLPLILLSTITALAVGLWLSALNVIYRDVQYVVPFLVQFWLFATPIAYPSGVVPEAWRPIYGLNPMAGVIEGFRWALLGSGRSLDPMFMVSVLIVFALLFTGLLYFRRTERILADIV